MGSWVGGRMQLVIQQSAASVQLDIASYIYMSEAETPKITATVKQNNPKSVEQRKPLAAISKAAKERKMLELEGNTVTEPEGDWLNYTYIALAGLVVGAVEVYLTYRKYYDNQSVAPSQVEVKHVEIKPTANSAPYKVLQTLD